MNDEYGVNGKHEEIGRRYDNAKFKGRVIEALKNLENSQTELRKDLKEYMHYNDNRIREIESWKDNLEGKIGMLVLFGSGLIGLVVANFKFLLKFIWG